MKPDNYTFQFSSNDHVYLIPYRWIQLYTKFPYTVPSSRMSIEKSELPKEITPHLSFWTLWKTLLHYTSSPSLVRMSTMYKHFDDTYASWIDHVRQICTLWGAPDSELALLNQCLPVKVWDATHSTHTILPLFIVRTWGGYRDQTELLLPNDCPAERLPEVQRAILDLADGYFEPSTEVHGESKSPNDDKQLDGVDGLPLLPNPYPPVSTCTCLIAGDLPLLSILHGWGVPSSFLFRLFQNGIVPVSTSGKQILGLARLEKPMELRSSDLHTCKRAFQWLQTHWIPFQRSVESQAIEIYGKWQALIQDTATNFESFESIIHLFPESFEGRKWTPNKFGLPAIVPCSAHSSIDMTEVSMDTKRALLLFVIYICPKLDSIEEFPKLFSVVRSIHPQRKEALTLARKLELPQDMLEYLECVQ